MRTEVIGPELEEPEFSIVYCIHGDEPCGKKAVEKLKNSNYVLDKPLKLVFANEKAYEQGERYSEVDLNRNFPGDNEGSFYEEKLAKKVLEEVRGTKNLVIHSTHSQPTPFAIMKVENFDQKLAESAGIDRIGLYEHEQGSLEGYTKSVVVEAGPQGTERALEQAYRMLLNFLATYNIIDKDLDGFNPEYYQVTDKVDAEGFRFLGKNFEKVEKEQKFAKKDDEYLKADKEFYPFLMSTNGYQGMLGFKSRKIENLENIEEF